MSFRQDGVNKNQAGSRTLDLEKKSTEMTTKSTKSCSRKIFSGFFSRAQDRLSPDFFSRGFRETASTDTDAASRTSPTPRRFTLSRSPPPPPRPRRSQFRVPDAQKELKSEIRHRFSDPFTDPTSTKSEQVSSFASSVKKKLFISTKISLLCCFEWFRRGSQVNALSINLGSNPGTGMFFLAQNFSSTFGSLGSRT